MTTARPVRVRSLFEAHLPVADVGRAVAFYRDVVGLEVAYEEAGRGLAFVWAGAPEALAAAGLTPRSFVREETAEPSVIGWMPAAAVYFEDPDGHVLEYLAMLDEPPRPEAGVVPWSEWNSGVSPGSRPRPRRPRGPRRAWCSAAGRTWSEVTISPSGTAAPCSRT